MTPPDRAALAGNADAGRAGEVVNKFIEDGELGDSVVREFRTTAAD